ncbi:iron chelate uptake ABC transporter family permease subunit [Corynebacterium sp. 335C]
MSDTTRTSPDLPEDAAAEAARATGADASAPGHAADDGRTATAVAVDASDADPRGRHAGPLPTMKKKGRYTALLILMIVLAAGFSLLYLSWDITVPFGSDRWMRIANMRVEAIIVILVVAFAQATATVAFQTVTYNRILTPSIMGFEALYRLIQTSAMFFLGVAGLSALEGIAGFLLQVAMMVALSALLYGWLLLGRRGNLQIMLLVGIVLGAGLGAVATFMQRLMTPGEFDILQARLIGSIANADTDYLMVCIPLVLVSGGILWFRSGRLNVLGLGRDTATNLGQNHKRETIIVLMLVAVLMACSTALVGPLTFLGFLVAMIGYQLADTYDHKLIFPMATLAGIAFLSGAYFILKEIFYAEGSVGIIIEVVGGLFFLTYIMRKGRL